ncbi:MAG: prolipoprotein diacylglyceryl transferase family protein [Polyangia bacterium]
MSANSLFVLVLVALVSAILTWGLRVLPHENMQFLATVPLRRIEGGLWRGVNLTWYGVMQMIAMVLGIALALVLAGAAGVPVYAVALVMAVLLAVALPAAGLVARVVERRRGTFTVGGAVFVGALFLPWTTLGLDAIFGSDHALPIMSALAVVYPLGEGIGRLACISFGCCYGRRLDECGPRVRALFARRPAVVWGSTRKAAYAGKCEGVPLLPTQALSALVLSAAGLGGVPLFLAGDFRAAGVLSCSVAFCWRFASEFLRADYRGEGRISPYQWMALACLLYLVPAFGFLSASKRLPDIQGGLTLLQSPITLLGLAVLGAVVFLYLGVSKVTTAIIRLGVREG